MSNSASGRIADRLSSLGIILPPCPEVKGNYVPFTVSGNLVFTAGQLSSAAGAITTGKLGAGRTLEEGQEAARLCAINLMSVVREACGGDLDRVKRWVKVNAFVNSHPEFADQPKVVNGASDLIGQVFGDAGKHARSAVGVANLPLNASVEIDAIIEIE